MPFAYQVIHDKVGEASPRRGNELGFQIWYQSKLFYSILSVNKRNADFTPNTDETVCQGHKWGLLAFWRYMSSELGINTEAIWEAIKDVVIKTIIRYVRILTGEYLNT